MTERLKVLNNILVSVENWDKTPQHAQIIIESIKPEIARLSEWESVSFTKEETALVNEITVQQRQLIESLKAEKAALALEMRALNKKTALVENYLYPKHTPTFVNQHL